MPPMTPDEKRECRDCGLLQDVPPLAGDSVAHCERCDAILRRATKQTEAFPLICASVALSLFLSALTIPFLSIKAPGREAHATVFAGPEWLNQQGMWMLSIVVLGILVVAPGLKLAGLVAVLAGARFKRPPRWLGPIFRYVKKISPWAMVEVFLLGMFIAYTRLDKLAEVFLEPATYLFGGVLLCTIAAESTMDEETIWDLTEDGRSDDEQGNHPHIMCNGCGRLERSPEGERCWRCDAVLHVRPPHSAGHTAALTLAASLLYIPANLLPVMTIKRLGHGEPSTILGGVIELAKANLLPLALLVFTASFIVPMMKIISLTTMLIATHYRSEWQLRRRTKLYRIVDAIGRWSMIDLFVLNTLVGLVHMGFLASVTPNWGSPPFCGVVILTMLAAESFDPRLMWDAAHKNHHAAFEEA